jgi:hypothetical protein
MIKGKSAKKDDKKDDKNVVEEVDLDSLLM